MLLLSILFRIFTLIMDKNSMKTNIKEYQKDFFGMFNRNVYV